VCFFAGEIIDMFGFLKNHSFAIGVDIGDDGLKLAQLANNGKGTVLVAGVSENRPEGIMPATVAWQKWAIETICQLTSNGHFRGREVIAAIPATEVFIDHIKMPKINDGKLEDAVFSKIKQKLPFEPVKENTMIKYIPAEEDNVLVMATERKVIDRHLAIYEQANLQIKSIGVWPMALANCYASFFGRRESDIKAVVMLLDIEPNCTNVVISRHRNLLFARSISIGAKHLGDEKMVTRLMLELTACRRQFGSMLLSAQIERLIFLSGRAVDRDVCAAIAKQLEMPAQIGDCLTAVETDGLHRFTGGPEHENGRSRTLIDRRDCRISWATAFGLSLS
jgi:type IV pilus assembly protein PilM